MCVNGVLASYWISAWSRHRSCHLFWKAPITEGRQPLVARECCKHSPKGGRGLDRAAGVRVSPTLLTSHQSLQAGC